MTHTTQDQDAEARSRAIDQYSTEAQRAVRLACTAIDELDAAAAIAHLRILKGALWRAERDGVTRMDLKPAVGPDQPQLGSLHINAEAHEGS
jgi:hypothetical protein